MSLILEALRKSEAERRRGAVPDVAMELPPQAVARPRPLPAWAVPALLAGAAIVFAAWWWSTRDRPTEPHAETPTLVEVATPRIAAPAPPAVAPRVEPSPVATPAASPTAPAATNVQTPVAEPVAEAPPAPVRAAPPSMPPPAPPPVIADIGANSMPSVKLSMHMWDESPARRFVILNGQRMGEGDRNGDIHVIAIERDGVVVERNGQQARVALP